MSKKTYLWLGVAIIIVIAAVYVLASLNYPGANGQYGSQEPGAKTGVNPAALNAENAAALKKSEVLPGYATESASIEQAPMIIVVDEKSFSPKNLKAKINSKVTFVLEASDEETHSLSFSDKVYAYIKDVEFSKEGGRKSITFPANVKGVYNFYIDQESNKGTLAVE
ncbi:MAG: cupredoxin domain-containing protein [Patescibacteria group bacterium]